MNPPPTADPPACPAPSAPPSPQPTLPPAPPRPRFPLTTARPVSNPPSPPRHVPARRCSPPRYLSPPVPPPTSPATTGNPAGPTEHEALLLRAREKATDKLVKQEEAEQKQHKRDKTAKRHDKPNGQSSTTAQQQQPSQAQANKATQSQTTKQQPPPPPKRTAAAHIQHTKRHQSQQAKSASTQHEPLVGAYARRCRHSKHCQCASQAARHQGRPKAPRANTQRPHSAPPQQPPSPPAPPLNPPSKPRRQPADHSARTPAHTLHLPPHPITPAPCTKNSHTRRRARHNEQAGERANDPQAKTSKHASTQVRSSAEREPVTSAARRARGCEHEREAAPAASQASASND
jgi:hypothetical protein